MGRYEPRVSAREERPLGYHPSVTEILNGSRLSRIRTLSGGQFDWGGRLLKSNGGAQRFSQNGWKPFAERKGIRELNCETNESSRYESRT